MTIVFAILLFSILIFVHELGHFIAAKAFGVQVNEFAMFMGPAIAKWGKGETKYSIRCIPIGGYCAMEGEDEDTDNPRSFQKAKWWKRLIILVAGSFMNLLAGFLIVLIVNSFLVTSTTQIDSIRTGSSMAQPGYVQAGDVILAIDGTELKNSNDFTKILAANPTETFFDILVSRDGKQLLLENVPLVKKEFGKDEQGEAGMFYGFTWGVRRLTAGEVIIKSWDDCVYFVKMVWFSLDMLFSGEVGIQDMSGPVGIVSVMNETAKQSDSDFQAIMSLLYLGSFIAVNLGVMNMLPVPALDGGRVFALLITTAIEAITKKKINPKYEGHIHGVGMLLLLGFMAVIMFKDIFTIVKG